MLKRLINAKSSTIIGAAIVLGLASFASRIVGILRDRLLVHFYGTSDVLDAYFTAFKIPDLLYLLLITGALSVGLIPIFSKVYHKDDDKAGAWKLINNIINISGLLLFAGALFFIILAPYIIPLIAPGFSPEKTKLTITLTRIMFLSPLFLGLSAIVGGVLQSLRHFFIYSLSPIFYNIGIIIGALFFVPIMGYSGLAWGVVLGAVLHLLIQLPIFIKSGWHYQRILDFKDINVRQIGKLMIPRVMALSALQINQLVITGIASTLTIGSVTVYNLANNLQSFPVGIIGVSFAVAVFPTLAILGAKNNKEEFIKNFSSATRQILFFIIPLSVLFLLLRAQIVRVVYGTGAFDWSATVNTADTLAFFAIGMFAQALLSLLVRAFYAFEDTKTPFYVSIVAVILNVYLSWLFTHGHYDLGVAGLALGFSIATVINGALLWVFLRSKLGSLDEDRILKSLFKMTIAGLFMGISIQYAKTLIAPYVNMDTFIGISSQGVGAGLIGLIVYVILGLVLRNHEMIIFVETIKKKLVRVKNVPEDITEIGEV